MPGLLKCFVDRFQPLGYDLAFWQVRKVALVIIGSSGLERVYENAYPLVDGREVVDVVFVKGWQEAVRKSGVRHSLDVLAKKIHQALSNNHT